MFCIWISRYVFYLITFDGDVKLGCGSIDHGITFGYGLFNIIQLSIYLFSFVSTTLQTTHRKIRPFIMIVTLLAVPFIMMDHFDFPSLWRFYASITSGIMFFLMIREHQSLESCK
jgi:hypothetical protein